MAVFKQSAVPTDISYKIRVILLWHKSMLSKTALLITILFGCFVLSACQTTPLSSTASTTIPNNSVIAPPSDSAAEGSVIVARADELDDVDFDIDYDDDSNDNIENDYPIEPYIPPAQTTTTPSYPTQTIPNVSVNEPIYEQVNEPIYETNNEPSTSSSSNHDDYNSQLPKLPSRNELLERARQNSQQQTRQTASDSSSLPAFRNLMQLGINQLKSGQLTAAESSFTRAQRLAPKSSAVYFYLAQVALKKNQPRKAEAMARRGLVVSQDASRRRALWQIILQSGQAQNNARVINEAKQALR